jgi:NAD(P)-dependent dehydrogenase (short-subunit alcohol dehydrogenase family)
MRHSEKRVIVAGGTGALGRAVTLAFLEQGAIVAVTSRRRAEYDALASAAGNERARLCALEGDVTDPAAAAAMVAQVVERYGGLDALVTTVGAWAGGAPLWETEPEQYRAMIDANLGSAFAMARAAVPHLIRAGRGWVVGVASRAATVPDAGAAAYAASKAGLVALFAALAAEVEPHRINVNLVSPAVIDTEANRRAMPDADFARWTKPIDIARVVLFLCSDEARAIHGAVVPVYGRA